MSCDCHKIGGPWISFDPDCPAHGYEAQREQKEREESESILREGLGQALEKLDELKALIEKLKSRI